TWTNNRGGSGTATGSTDWNIAAVGLQPGTNVITVTARDGANNPGTDTLTITYGAPVIAPMPDGTTACGSLYAMDVPLISGLQPMTWTLPAGPPGMQIDANSGALSWPNPIPVAMPYIVTVQAMNSFGSDMKSWHLTVKPGDFDG